MKYNIVKNVAIGVLLITFWHLGFSQGFINLNFESAQIISDPSGNLPGDVYATNAMPGWTAYVGGTAQSTILYNNTTVGSSSIAIWGNYTSPFLSFNALQGKYSAE